MRHSRVRSSEAIELARATRVRRSRSRATSSNQPELPAPRPRPRFPPQWAHHICLIARRLSVATEESEKDQLIEMLSTALHRDFVDVDTGECSSSVDCSQRSLACLTTGTGTHLASSMEIADVLEQLEPADASEMRASTIDAAARDDDDDATLTYFYGSEAVHREASTAESEASTDECEEVAAATAVEPSSCRLSALSPPELLASHPKPLLVPLLASASTSAGSPPISLSCVSPISPLELTLPPLESLS